MLDPASITGNLWTTRRLLNASRIASTVMSSIHPKSIIRHHGKACRSSVQISRSDTQGDVNEYSRDVNGIGPSNYELPSAEGNSNRGVRTETTVQSIEELEMHLYALMARVEILKFEVASRRQGPVRVPNLNAMPGQVGGQGGCNRLCAIPLDPQVSQAVPVRLSGCLAAGVGGGGLPGRREDECPSNVKSRVNFCSKPLQVPISRWKVNKFSGDRKELPRFLGSWISWLKQKG